MKTGTCIGCGKTIKPRSRVCESPDCHIPAGLQLLKENSVQVGEHVHWSGKRRTHGRPVFSIPDPSRPSGAHDYLVTSFVMRHVNGIDFHRSSSVQTTCGDKECIRGEHLEVRTKTEFKTLMPRAVKLSTQPILEWVEAHPAIEWAGGHHRELIKRKELTVFQVDAICIDSLKIHPAALYGDEFWKGIDDEVA